MNTKKYYEYLKDKNLVSNFYQFDNKITAFQYIFPHQKTSISVRKGDNVLDWGCGQGHFSCYLDYIGCKTYGYSFDGFPEGLKNRKEFVYEAGNEKDPVKIPFKNKKFDSVFSIGVLEHVHETGGDQIDSLKEINRILKSGSRFYCFHLPNKFSWVEAIISIIYKFGKVHGSAPHSKKFSKNDVKKLLENSGFELIEYHRYNFLPRNLTKRVFPNLVHKNYFQIVFEKTDFIFSKIFPFICNQTYFCAQKI
ncbi:MAG: class I SAM-dependent methyltransferase [Candidatus Marinimicrobia bacterium]|jgi:SAM-dependent methyltransferase|nr:class I SAM-dependent methyltransferase [Candidatus Neomarinimicrobiota bacterium]